MDRKLPPFSVISGDPEAKPQRPQPGHYFDQTIFELHYSLQTARARRMALEGDLEQSGVEIDPRTGEVRLPDRAEG